MDDRTEIPHEAHTTLKLVRHDQTTHFPELFRHDQTADLPEFDNAANAPGHDQTSSALQVGLLFALTDQYFKAPACT